MGTLLRMEMSKELETLFNRQITLELGSSNAYLQMSAYLDSHSLTGMAEWMRIQAEEERDHALRFLQFVLDRGNEVAIGAIDAPDASFDGPSAVFAAALAQERAVTASISELYDAAQRDADVASLPLLQEFLTEQVEEEAAVGEVLDRLNLAGSSGGALLELDRELGDRQPE